LIILSKFVKVRVIYIRKSKWMILIKRSGGTGPMKLQQPDTHGYHGAKSNVLSFQHER